jgi:two-component system CheB/CheR fusion protein
MHEASTDVQEGEIRRLVHALQQHVNQGAVPDVLRYLTDELEKRTLIERRCVELSESEQLARSEAREHQAANQAKDRFLAVLSHELRTPLQPVLAAAAALLRDPRVPHDLLEDVRTIQRNVQLEARLIDDLLDLTRIANGKLALEASPININSVIARTVEICDPEAINKRLHLSVRLNAGRSWVSADPGRLQQVMWNLIKNAVKFTPLGGEINIETENHGGDELIVRVIDTGIGIEPEVLPKIFEAFEQADEKVTRRFGGLGLGLTISKMLVDWHRGTLTATSEGAGRGSTFTLTLPTIDTPQPAGRPVSHPPAPPATARRPLHIMLVEDDQTTSVIMSKLLRSVGHAVVTATDCASTDRLIDKGDHFDLLLCDIALPDGTGLDLVRRVKRIKGEAIRAIALTGYGTESDIESSLRAGFDCHLTKPITLTQLVDAIDRLFP